MIYIGNQNSMAGNKKGGANNMIYLSSNKERKSKIKDICKKYKELPPYIVKQIIDYEIYKSNKFDLSKAIKDVWNINHEISITEKAIKDEIKTVKTIDSPLIYELPVFIDCGNGYATRTTVKLAMDRIDELRRIRRRIIQTARCEHAVRPFFIRKEKNL